MSRMGSGFRKSLVLVGILALVVPLLVVFAAPVSAATVTVCPAGPPTCDYATVTAAVAGQSYPVTINVYPDPGTYDESVNLYKVSGGDVTLIAVNSAGTPTPGAATVDGGGGPAFYTSSTHSGNITIDGFVAKSASFDGIALEVNSDIVISNVTASSTGFDGIYVVAGGDVTISDCTANGNLSGDGIYVDYAGGDVTISDCTANGNGDEGIHVDGVDGNVTISGCTANGNLGGDGIYVEVVGGNVTIRNCTATGNRHDGIEPSRIAGALEVSACISQENGDDGIHLWYLEEADSIAANGNIICGNASDGLEFNFVGIEGRVAVAATNTDATGNWWGCAAGPADAACDSVNEISGSVDHTPWIDTITASASADPATVGQPTVVSFQFSGGPPTVYLGQGPGDLRGPAPFTVSTDNGTLNGNGATVQEFINAANGTLEVTLTPAQAGTATVWVYGPCGLDGSIVLGVGAEFVPEPGSVLLLGSGLMGLAGYAALRLRSGQGLRLRKRQM